MSNSYIDNDIPQKSTVTENSENDKPLEETGNSSLPLDCNDSHINKSENQTDTDNRSVNFQTNQNSEIPVKINGDVMDTGEKNNEWLDILGSGGIMKKTIVEGESGTQPTKNEKCSIKYSCSLENGTVVESMSQFTFFLGESDVSNGFCNLYDLFIGYPN